MATKNILIVEDDEDIQAIYKEILEASFDVRLTQTYNGRQGLEAVHACKPDLILLDILMPIMNGDEFLKELRLTLDIRDVPVIVCSVNQALANKLFADRLADGVLPKLFGQKDLIALVSKFLNCPPQAA
jgi:CheY-like chemotaxis protein